jgi:hypothetical protein
MTEIQTDRHLLREVVAYLFLQAKAGTNLTLTVYRIAANHLAFELDYGV